MPKRKTILIVDDEPSIRFFAVRVLEKAGHLVLSAETADEVNGIWNLVGRAIDLVITDMMMPGFNGIELAKQLRRTRRDLKILFVTGSLEMDDEIAALGGETRLVRKPYTSQTLRQSVDAMFVGDR